MAHNVSIVVMLAALAPPAFAQATIPVAVDQRARITTNDATYVGRVVTVAADSLRLATDEADPISIATPSIRRVEVSRGRESKAKKYAIRGAIIAGVIGAISLGLQHDTVGEEGSSAGKAAALGAFSGGLFGGLIGGAIGATKGADRWEHVWP
jgi:hypothetical protein